jgi:hypothetical protein
MSKNVKFPEIKTNLRALEAESREIRKRIHAASGMDRWHLWNEKRGHGREARWLLLAYAYLRKVPYRVCEQKCALDNSPSPSAIQHWLKTYGHEVERDLIDAWLEAEPAVAVAA